MILKPWRAFAFAFLPLFLPGTFSAGQKSAENYSFPFQIRPITVSGTFGELRSNHFHSGLDIKTGTDTGIPVYSISDGYVYRLKVSAYGFGRALYIRHPDEKFSVYAHLDRFNNEMEEFVYQKQFASKDFEQEIYLGAGEIPVKKGQLVAFSGNSGASTGPHLHFEIREADERIINPITYFPGVINDSKKPQVSAIAIQPLDASSRVHGVFEKQVIHPSGSDGSYRVVGLIPVSGTVGIEYHAWDLLDDAPNQCGINYSRLYLDGKKIYEFSLERFSFDEKKYINLHFDYAYFREAGKRFQRCYLQEGNEFGSYRDVIGGGKIRLQDDLVHTFRLELEDARGNQSSVTGNLQRQDAPGDLNIRHTTSPSVPGWQLDGKTLVMYLSSPKPAHANGITLFFEDGTDETILPAYLSDGKLYFLYQVSRWKMPVKMFDPLTRKETTFGFQCMVLPNRSKIVEYGESQIYFPYNCVFDTLALQIRNENARAGIYSDILHVGDPDVPILNPFILNFSPVGNVEPGHLVVAELKSSGSWEYLGGNLQSDGRVHASSGYFGSFCLMTDSIPPAIKPLDFSDGGSIGGGSRQLTLQITDNFSGVDSRKIVVTLDGQWILPEFDGKSGRTVHRWRQRPASGRHVLEVIASDGAGNMQSKEFHINF